MFNALHNDGTANVQIQIGTFRNPTVRTTIDFVASTIPVSVEDENAVVEKYYLHKTIPIHLIHLQKLIMD